MQKIKLFTLSLLCTITFYQASANIEGNWYEGEVKLLTGEVLQGKVNYDMDKNILLFRREEQFKIFQSFEIELFEFFDTNIKGFRLFYALPSQGVTNSTYTFWELVLQGDLALFSREKEVLREGIGKDHPSYYLKNENLDWVYVDDFFVLNTEGQFYPINSQNDLFEVVEEKFILSLKDFCKTKKINVKNRGNIAMLINYYNSLISAEAKM